MARSINITDINIFQDGKCLQSIENQAIKYYHEYFTTYFLFLKRPWKAISCRFKDKMAEHTSAFNICFG